MWPTDCLMGRDGGRAPSATASSPKTRVGSRSRELANEEPNAASRAFFRSSPLSPEHGVERRRRVEPVAALREGEGGRRFRGVAARRGGRQADGRNGASWLPRRLHRQRSTVDDLRVGA